MITTDRDTRHAAALHRLAARRAADIDLMTEVGRISATPVTDLAAALADTVTDEQLADWIGVSVEAVRAWYLLGCGGMARAIEDALAARA